MQLAQFFTNEKKIHWTCDVILYGSPDALQWPIHKQAQTSQDSKKAEIKIATHYYERISHSRIGKHSDRHRPDVFMSIICFMI
jgi:hypothetical protein